MPKITLVVNLTIVCVWILAVAVMAGNPACASAAILDAAKGAIAGCLAACFKLWCRHNRRSLIPTFRPCSEAPIYFVAATFVSWKRWLVVAYHEMTLAFLTGFAIGLVIGIVECFVM